MSHVCEGEPPGRCIVIVDDERIWCHGCIYRRQEALASGLPTGLPTPIGIVLQDIEAPVLQCECGGMAQGYRHAESLLHRTWAFRVSSPDYIRDSVS